MLNNNFRPVSPNLAVYKPQASSLQSIFHRISGFILVMVLYISFSFIHFQPALLPQIYLNQSHYLNLSISIILNIIVLALSYHIINGIRYIISWKI